MKEGENKKTPRMHRFVTSDGCLGGGKLDAPRVNGGDRRGIAPAALAALAAPAAPAALAAAVATPSAQRDSEELVRGHGHLWGGEGSASW